MKVSQILHLAVLIMVGAASLSSGRFSLASVASYGRGTVQPESIC